MTAENLSERLEHLERSVKQAAEAIGAPAQGARALQAGLPCMERGSGRELQSSASGAARTCCIQVDGILKELDKLDL